MLSKQCAGCGETFYKKVNVPMSEWENQTKFCSRPCYWKNKKQHPLKTCPVCDKEFHDNWKPEVIYCSNICAGLGRRKPLPLCGRCGKPCKKRNRRFCSHQCKVEWYRGENVYNYLEDGGKQFYNSTFWKERAQEIRERDKICQRCGFEPGPNDGVLHVHHIVPRHISNDHSDSNLIALCESCHQTEHAGLPIRGKNRYRQNVT